jgi:Cytochrome P460
MKTIVIGRFVATSAILLLGPLGCSVQPAGQVMPPDPGIPSSGAVTEDHSFDGPLLEVARSYKQFSRIGEVVRLTAVPCAPPPRPVPPSLSASVDSGTHGRKLYWLYVKELPLGYTEGDYSFGDKPNPVGQVVVKEAWHPQEVNADEKNDVVGRFKQAVDKDGRVFCTGEQGHLFIMAKLDPSTPGTDEGWVYGTVTPDGKQVTCAGRVKSCMACHRDAPHDRLFGLAKK